MKIRRRLAIIVVALTVILSILACGGSVTPTATPKPQPTQEVKQPTATAKPVVKPTKEVPTKEAAPTTAVSDLSSDCASAAEGKLDVAYVLGYKDTADYWRVVGLVCNKTSRAVSNVQLELEVLDKDGKSLYTEKSAYTALYSLDAGEATPFSVGIYQDLPTADTVKATIVGNDAADLKRATVETQNIKTLVDDKGDAHITGEVINNGKDPVEIHGLAAATFDKNNKMVTADYAAALMHYLPPGGTGAFRITMYGPKSGTDTIDNYQIYFDAEATTEQAYLADAEKDLTKLHDYMDAYGQFHLVGEYTNNGDKNVGVRLVASITDKDGNVIDASTADTPISAVKPGETVPYEFNYWGPLDDKKGTYDAADKYVVKVDPIWTWDTDTQLVDLKTQDDTNDFDEYQGTFKGSVVNDTGGDLKTVTVMVGIYGKTGEKDEGQIVATGYSYADITDTLADGKTATYTVYVPIPEGFNIDTHEYRIVVKGQKP